MAESIHILGNEEYLPKTTGAASSFSEARLVRLINDGVGISTVFVVETQSGTGIGSISMHGNTSLTIQKAYAHCIYAETVGAATSVKGAKVGFTN